MDRLSGWLEVVDLGSRNVNTESVIKAIRRIFSSFGVPRKLRSDGGPQFSSAQFQDFLKTWGISHGMSAPKYPQRNGLAEAAVKVLKHLLATATQNGNLNSDEFHRGLIELRNTPRANGRSPSEIVFGHSMRSCIPVYRSKNSVIGRCRNLGQETGSKCKESSTDIYSRGGMVTRPRNRKVEHNRSCNQSIRKELSSTTSKWESVVAKQTPYSTKNANEEESSLSR